MTQVVLPGDANPHGSTFGGRILQWVDLCAAVAAHRHARAAVVTASMDDVHFLLPIAVGDIVVLQAQVNYAGRTSMEVGVRVMAEDVRSGRRRHAVTAYVTFVAVDQAGRPKPVPPLAPQTDDDRRRLAAAQERRARRLTRRQERIERRRAKGEA
jgi:acyl-CoA hydrolase